MYGQTLKPVIKNNNASVITRESVFNFRSALVWLLRLIASTKAIEVRVEALWLRAVSMAMRSAEEGFSMTSKILGSETENPSWGKRVATAFHCRTQEWSSPDL